MMKTIFKTALAFFLIAPMCMFAQDNDTETAAGVVFIEGTIKIDGKGVYLESSDCAYSGNYYLGGVLSEDTGDKKADKKNKKANKKVAKKVKTTTKRVSKAKGQVLENREIKCTINEEARMISPIKVINPMYEPKVLGLTPICDATLLAIYALYVETDRIKQETRIISFKTVKSEDSMVEQKEFYDINCNKIGMDELKRMSPQIKRVLTEANIAVLANIAAVAIVLANTKAINAELKEAGGLAYIAGMKSLVEAGIFQVRLLNDNKRLRDRIKECKGIMEMLGE